MTVSRELKVLSHTMRPFAADTATPPGLQARRVFQPHQGQEGFRKDRGRGKGEERRRAGSNGRGSAKTCKFCFSYKP